MSGPDRRYKLTKLVKTKKKKKSHMKQVNEKVMPKQ